MSTTRIIRWGLAGLMATGLLGCGVAASEDVDADGSAVKTGSAFITPLADGIYDAQDATLALYSHRGAQYARLATGKANAMTRTEPVDVELIGRRARVTTFEGDELELSARGDVVELKGTGPFAGSYRKRPTDALVGRFVAKVDGPKAPPSLVLSKASVDDGLAFEVTLRSGETLRGGTTRWTAGVDDMLIDLRGCESFLTARRKGGAFELLIHPVQPNSSACAFFADDAWYFKRAP